MTDAYQILEVLLMGAQIGAAVVAAVVYWRGSLPLPGRLLLLGAAASFVIYRLVNSAAFALLKQNPVLEWGSVIAAGAITPLFWIIVMAVFDDRRVRSALLLPLAVQMALAALTYSRLDPAFWYAFNAAGAGLGLHAFYVIGRGWTGDLIESRRRLRRQLLAIGIVGAGVVAAFFILNAAERNGVEMTGPMRILNIVYAGVILALVAIALDERRVFFATPPAKSPRTVEDEDAAALTALNKLMTEGEAWRREGLSIGALADELGLPEHRLRRLINGNLGHRNFAAFLNAYRIEAAKHRLASPSSATVAEIAFEAGFTSLSPFNRAFKEATGETPTEWRRRVAAADPAKKA